MGICKRTNTELVEDMLGKNLEDITTREVLINTEKWKARKNLVHYEAAPNSERKQTH